MIITKVNTPCEDFLEETKKIYELGFICYTISNSSRLYTDIEKDVKKARIKALSRILYSIFPFVFVYLYSESNWKFAEAVAYQMVLPLIGIPLFFLQLATFIIYFVIVLPVLLISFSISFICWLMDGFICPTIMLANRTLFIRN